MRKGITPIISIIILLLITVGLAAAAWTYMSNYMTSLTAKAIEIPTQKCVTDPANPNQQQVLAIVHNIGTSSLTVGGANSDLVILDNQGVTPQGVTYEDMTGAQLNEGESIKSGDYFRVRINCCSGSECPKTCTYDFIVSGRSQSVNVYCPKP